MKQRRTPDERLRLFCSSVSYALSRRAVTNKTIDAGFKLHLDSNKKLAIETRLGDEEDVRSLLLEVRKYFASGSDIKFTKINDLTEAKLSADDLRDHNHALRAEWKRICTRDVLVSINGINYTPEDSFVLFANGIIFHDDKEKAAQVEGLDAIARGLLLTNVNRLVIQALQLANTQRLLIEHVLSAKDCPPSLDQE